jgi:hypothetical protein
MRKLVGFSTKLRKHWFSMLVVGLPRHIFGYYEAAGRDTGITSILPEFSSICNTGKY